MGRKGHDQQLIAEALEKFDQGMPLEEICSRYGIARRTFYRWKLRRNGNGSAEARPLRQIEDENQRLKAIVAELLLENRALRQELAGRQKSARSERPEERLSHN